MSDRLASLLAPATTAVFYERYQAREYLYVSRNLAGFYDDVLTIEDLDIFLQSELTPAVFFNAVSGGVRQPVEAWSRERHSSRGSDRVVVPERLFTLYGENTTLILNQLNHAIPPLAQACRELTRELEFPVQANIYITPAESQGFDRHTDDHDVMILQISGRKFWTLHPRDAEPVRLEIRPGDFLYIPSGLAHEASCSVEASIHVTMGLHPPYSYRLLEELAAAARTHPDFQQPAPPPSASPEVKRNFEAAFEQRVRDLLSKTNLDMLLERRFHSLVEKQGQGWRGRFSDMLRLREITADSVLQSRDEIATSVEVRGQNLVLHFAGANIEIPEFLAIALSRIREPAPFVVRELPGMMTEMGKVGFVRPFVQRGLLSIVKL